MTFEEEKNDLRGQHEPDDRPTMRIEETKAMKEYFEVPDKSDKELIEMITKQPLVNDLLAENERLKEENNHMKRLLAEYAKNETP